MRWWLVASIAYLSLGLVWFAFSGRLEGFTSPRTFVMFVGLILVPFAVLHSAENIYFLIAIAFRRRTRSLASLITPIVATGAMIALFFGGIQLDEWVMAQTKERAKTITSRIVTHKAENDICPASLDHLFAAGETIPKPAIRGASFDYTVGKFGQCYLKFPAHNWIVCNWNDRTNDWYCAD